MKGDFQSFVEQRYAEFLRTAFLLTGTRQAAEDLLQQSMLQVMTKWEKLDQPEAYLYKSMVKRCSSLWSQVTSLRRWRGRSRQRSVTSALSDGFGQGDQLLIALDWLPAKTRAVLVFCCWVGMPTGETASLLGCSVASVDRHIMRGLVELERCSSGVSNGYTR